MVNARVALNPNKRVPDGIRAVAAVNDAWLVVAGDGPMRDELERRKKIDVIACEV